MNKKYIKMYLIEFAVLAGLILIDRLASAGLVNFLQSQPDGRSFVIIENFFRLYLSQNDGMAFSFLSGYTGLLAVLSSIMCAGILGYLIIFKKEHRLLRTGLVILLAGALGNLYDRIFLGFVWDYFHFNFWAIFNVADIFIVVGAIIIGIYVIFHLKEEAKKEKEKKAKADA